MSAPEVPRPSAPELAGFAQQLADPSRATMLLALMDGRAWTIGELARQAGIARNTASEHVGRLVAAGMVSHTKQGRHSYITLAGPDLAAVIESMTRLAGIKPAAPSLRAHRHDEELAQGRTCYQHLAGRLGVELADRWLRTKIITEDWEPTEAGIEWFESIGVRPPSGPRPLLRPCLDWTERRPHAAGPLATALARSAFAEGWVIRGHHPRAARLTAKGRAVLES